MAKTIHISLNCPISIGEALALHHALEWLNDMSFDNVDFTSNSKAIDDAFHHAHVDVTETGQIIPACRCLFTSRFTNSKVEFYRQLANEVDHTLAGVATLLANPTTYYNVPRCIEPLTINEVINEMI